MTEPVAYRWKFEDEPDSAYALRKQLPKWYDRKKHVDIVMEELYTKSPYIDFLPIEDLPEGTEFFLGWAQVGGFMMVSVGSQDGETRFYDQSAAEYHANIIRVYPTHFALLKAPDV